MLIRILKDLFKSTLLKRMREILFSSALFMFRHLPPNFVYFDDWTITDHQTNAIFQVSSFNSSLEATGLWQADRQRTHMGRFFFLLFLNTLKMLGNLILIKRTIINIMKQLTN